MNAGPVLSTEGEVRVRTAFQYITKPGERRCGPHASVQPVIIIIIKVQQSHGVVVVYYSSTGIKLSTVSNLLREGGLLPGQPLRSRTRCRNALLPAIFCRGLIFVFVVVAVVVVC